MPRKARQIAGDHPGGDDADRQVHIEHAAPAPVFGHEATQHRTDGVRNAESGGDHRHPTDTPRGIGEQVGNRRKGRADQHAAADTLQRARDDEFGHAARRAAQRRRCGKRYNRQQYKGLATIQITQTPGERHGHGRSQQITGAHPAVIFKALQFGNDARHGRPDHGLIKRGQHHHKANAQHGQKSCPSVELFFHHHVPVSSKRPVYAGLA